MALCVPFQIFNDESSAVKKCKRLNITDAAQTGEHHNLSVNVTRSLLQGRADLTLLVCAVRWECANARGGHYSKWKVSDNHGTYTSRSGPSAARGINY